MLNFRANMYEFVFYSANVLSLPVYVLKFRETCCHRYTPDYLQASSPPLIHLEVILELWLRLQLHMSPSNLKRKQSPQFLGKVYFQYGFETD